MKKDCIPSDLLAEKIVAALDDFKAQNTLTFDLRAGTGGDFDYAIIATGRSNRHVRSVCDGVVRQLRKDQIRSYGIEGDELGQWILVDFGVVMLHVLQEEARNYYQLEKIWGFYEDQDLPSHHSKEKQPSSAL